MADSVFQEIGGAGNAGRGLGHPGGELPGRGDAVGRQNRPQVGNQRLSRGAREAAAPADFQSPNLGRPDRLIGRDPQNQGGHTRSQAGGRRPRATVVDDGATGGGVYLWTSRQTAHDFSEATIRPMIKERFHVEPSITYFETPVIVDNVSSQILS